jgi:hypothetical protein
VVTCCIDKSSSSELSEAINSMYRWYKNAKFCYAYLSNARTSDTLEFSRSRWFSRSWTLQELIAPLNVKFYGFKWLYLGSKARHIALLSQITDIDALILAGNNPAICSISQRMSWASKRETTQAEDIAYCMMVLFDVNMPLLYGEGSKAFIRLQ